MRTHTFVQWGHTHFSMRTNTNLKDLISHFAEQRPCCCRKTMELMASAECVPRAPQSCIDGRPWKCVHREEKLPEFGGAQAPHLATIFFPAHLLPADVPWTLQDFSCAPNWAHNWNKWRPRDMSRKPARQRCQVRWIARSRHRDQQVRWMRDWRGGYVFSLYTSARSEQLLVPLVACVWAKLCVWLCNIMYIQIITVWVYVYANLLVFWLPWSSAIRSPTRRMRGTSMPSLRRQCTKGEKQVQNYRIFANDKISITPGYVFF